MRLLDRFRRKTSPLRDYLYVDRTRLTSYLEQISSTTTYDKVPSVGVGLSVTGPSVSAEQPRVRRDKSDHEKVSELIAYLERHGHLGHRRPVLVRTDHEDLALPDFVLEQCDAVRVLIPAAAPERNGGVVVWVSDWPMEREERVLRPAGLLCIIQDSTSDDSRHRVGFEHSSYTWLQALLLQLHQQPSSEIQLAAQFPLSPTGDYRFDLMSAQGYLRSEMEMLRRKPLA